jgi:hypothetical protein
MSSPITKQFPNQSFIENDIVRGTRRWNLDLRVKWQAVEDSQRDDIGDLWEGVN